MANTLLIRKEKGEIAHKKTLLNKLNLMLDSLRNGEYKLVISKVSNQRSNNQNAMMWMWFACLAMDSGSTKDDYYDYYRELFLSRNITVNGKETKVTSGTSGLNTVQFTHFLNQIQADAASEFGVKLPTPDDLYWEEFKNYYKQFI